MRSSRLLFLGFSTLLTAGPLVAQPPASGGQAGAQPRAHAGQDRHRAGGPRGGMRGPVMRDITLTDAQKAQLKAVNERYRPRYQALRDEARSKWQGRRADGATRPDSAGRAAFRAEREAFRGRMRELRQRQLADVRAILTPAQQASFDRNVAELRQRETERAAQRAGRGPGRGAGRAGGR